MKTTDEISARAFARRDEHEKKLSKRKRVAAFTVIPALAVALTAGVLAASGVFSAGRIAGADAAV